MRAAAAVLLTIWWLPLGFLSSLAIVANSLFAELVFWTCVFVTIALSVPQIWARINKCRQHQELLRVTRWLLYGLPFATVAFFALRHPNGVTAFKPEFWWQVAIAGGAVTLPCSVAALLFVAPMFGARTEPQQMSVIGAAIAGWSMTAYVQIATTLRAVPPTFELQSIDAVFTGLLFAPTAAILFGVTMIAVVRREAGLLHEPELQFAHRW